MTTKKLLIWDETFPALFLTGEGASVFLHGQTTADVISQKKDENIFKTCWLSTKGSLRALLETRFSDDVAKIMIICGNLESIMEGFESVIFPADKVKLEIAKPIRRIQIINDYDSWKDSIPTWVDCEDFIPDEIKNSKKLTKKELEVWKIKQGLPRFNRELNGETNPYELGLVDTINLDKGCYLGQEAMARFFRSKSYKYQLRYWEAYGESTSFETGQKIIDTNQDKSLKKNVGFITSSIAINENFFNGLALIKTNSLEKGCFFNENGNSITIEKPISFSET